MSLLPLRGEEHSSPDKPRVLSFDNEVAGETIEALSAATTRTVLSMIYERSSTPADIQNEIGTSIQNVHYHIKKLEDVELIEPAGVGYSTKGTEVTLYAPANEAVVLFAGRDRTRHRLQEFFR